MRGLLGFAKIRQRSGHDYLPLLPVRDRLAHPLAGLGGNLAGGLDLGRVHQKVRCMGPTDKLVCYWSIKRVTHA